MYQVAGVRDKAEGKGRGKAVSSDSDFDESDAEGDGSEQNGQPIILVYEFKAQLAEMERSFGAMLRQLPSKTEVDNLLVDISQTGLAAGLEEKLFQPQGENKKDFYAELPINIRITGNYHDMGAFASDIAQLPRIVTLNDVAIANDKGILAMDAVAKTYRYLDEEEVAKQRRAAKDAKEAGKK